jgi:GNAT superfamily N-acetyltransferase
MKNLPISMQSLSKIYENNAIYVDKTPLIHQFISVSGAYFLSRPRRFGKSLLVSTLKELFEGNKILFKDLWIEDNWDWSQKNPVIHISFASLDYQGLGLTQAIIQELEKQATLHGFSLKGKTIKSCFKELLNLLYQKKGKVVLLIDEYDKPIIEYLEDNYIKQAKLNQKVLKIFYSVLKDAEPILRLIFITGVSKFAKVSIFSDLNHLHDLTLDIKYSTLTGYTQTELEYYFKDYLHIIKNDLNILHEQLIEQMRIWYNGFSWDGVNLVYNPFGTLTFLQQKVFRNYWFSSATPTFLLEQMKKQGQFVMENSKVDASFLEKSDLDNIDVVQLLFQTGYLTVRKLDVMTGDMVLDYPNKEVRDSMYRFLLRQ